MTCYKSVMIIKVHSDGSLLSVQGARSWEAGHFYCVNNTQIQQEEPHQGAIYQECSIIKTILASVAQCETLTLFLNFQNTIVMRMTTK